MKNKSKDTKALFLSVARVLFLERSFSDVTVAEICEKAGKAKGLFFYYFEQKDDILKSLASIEIDKMRDSISSYLMIAPESNLKKLEFLMHAMISPEADVPEFMQYFGENAPPDFFEAFVHELRDKKMLPLIQAIVRNGVEADEFENVSDDEVSLIYMGISTYIHRNFDEMIGSVEFYQKAIKTIEGVIEKSLGISTNIFHI